MPKLKVELNQADIRELIAERYGVPVESVTITVHKGYDGPPTDCQAPYVEAKVDLDGGRKPAAPLTAL